MRKRRDIPKLGELQLAILEVLWANGDATFADVKRELADRGSATTTLATVVGRLEQAGLIAHDGSARFRVYRPLVSRAEVQSAQTRGLVNRLFAGKPSELVHHLVRESEFDPAELSELRRLLGAKAKVK